MRPSWKQVAHALRIGQRLKIQCCGTDRSALASNNDRGISLHCFRCGRKEWEPHGERSIHEIMATRRADAALTKSATMPEDAVALMDGPSAALQWVLAGGLQPEIAHETYHFRWHAQSRRVLIPLSDHGLLGRAVHGERPKYRLFGRGSLYWATGDLSRPLVVVEDILSAIAVSRVGWPSVAVLGTSISPEQAREIAKPKVIGWFDDDKAGNKGWISLRKRMALYPVKLSRIMTQLDPKALHRADLIEHLERHP